jgi:membrane protein implicated in regulation of membrane protease activity
MEILWWHWVVLGIALMLLELAVPAFFLVWFGLGAVVVGILLAIFPTMTLAYQIIIWTVLALLLIWLWFKIFKPSFHKTKAGMAHGALVGEIGLVTKDIRPYENGQVRFQKPILGEEVWPSMADQEIRSGERVRVLDVEGNTLKVVKV